MTDSATHPCTDSSQPKKKAGRRVGSKGYSRNLTLAVTRIVPHRPVRCSLCGQAFEDMVYQISIALYELELEVGRAETLGFSAQNHVWFADATRQSRHCIAGERDLAYR
ncbi:hypothetical protein [Methylomicrobium lacus]|uniref:hypothetical protein n=1 Tax=Methylomicrobium lacus TaxID=136992 RepID=UPI001267CF8E|nr:hypothetical protein [Methylomicrobium lacus]